MNVKIKYLITAALFTSMICVGAWLKIPFLFVPMTLQFFFVNTAIIAQKTRYSVLSVAAYIFLGLIGIPVFSGGGGPAYILNPTFGYIAGFLLAALISGFIKTNNYLKSFINLAIVYIFGLTYLYLITNYYIGSTFSLSKTLLYGCLIFIPGDIVKIILSCTVLKYLEKLHLFHYVKTTENIK